jgi:hypothetical protein
MKRMSALLLSLLLVTAQSSAFAHGRMIVADQFVICSGQTLRVVNVDVHGNEVSVREVCPDCVQLSAASIPDAPSVDFDADVWHVKVVAVRPLVVSKAALKRNRTRGPPCAV